MAHKGTMMYFLHPGDLKRYYKEKDFTWKDIRKIGYYPKDIAAQIEEEKHLRKETTEPKIAIPGEVLEMSEADLRKLIDEYLTEDRIFEHVKEIVNQSKPQRIVINLPAWLKERLKHKSAKKGLSMNAVMRLALTEYLAKDE